MANKANNGTEAGEMENFKRTAKREEEIFPTGTPNRSPTEKQTQLPNRRRTTNPNEKPKPKLRCQGRNTTKSYLLQLMTILPLFLFAHHKSFPLIAFRAPGIVYLCNLPNRTQEEFSCFGGEKKTRKNSPSSVERGIVNGRGKGGSIFIWKNTLASECKKRIRLLVFPGAIRRN